MPEKSQMRSNGTDCPARPPLLAALARKVRRMREQRDWSRGELARRSGLSERFLARVESGEGNISVLRLESLAHALDTTPDRLVQPDADPTRIIAWSGCAAPGRVRWVRFWPSVSDVRSSRSTT